MIGRSAPQPVGGIPMYTPNDNTASLRIGVRRIFPPWEFRHLRAWAAARIGAGIVLTVCGVLTLSFGGKDRETYGWTAFWLVLAALTFAAAYWELTIARSASPRT
jgi:hypothetical protein